MRTPPAVRPEIGSKVHVVIDERACCCSGPPEPTSGVSVGSTRLATQGTSDRTTSTAPGRSPMVRRTAGTERASSARASMPAAPWRSRLSAWPMSSISAAGGVSGVGRRGRTRRVVGEGDQCRGSAGGVRRWRRPAGDAGRPGARPGGESGWVAGGSASGNKGHEPGVEADRLAEAFDPPGLQVEGDRLVGEVAETGAHQTGGQCGLAGVGFAGEDGDAAVGQADRRCVQQQPCLAALDHELVEVPLHERERGLGGAPAADLDAVHVDVDVVGHHDQLVARPSRSSPVDLVVDRGRPSTGSSEPRTDRTRCASASSSVAIWTSTSRARRTGVTNRPGPNRSRTVGQRPVRCGRASSAAGSSSDSRGPTGLGAAAWAAVDEGLAAEVGQDARVDPGAPRRPERRRWPPARRPPTRLVSRRRTDRVPARRWD